MAKLKAGSRVYGSLRVDGTFVDSTGSAGSPGQVLSATVSGTAWSSAGGGGGGITSYAKYVGTGTINTVNGSTTYTQISWINTTPVFSSGTWSASATGITVPNTGLYLVQVNWYMDSVVQRANVGIRFAVNGTTQPEIAAHGYIRAGTAGGHNESSENLTTTLSLTANDVVSIYAAQLAAPGTVNLQGANSSISITQLA